MTYFIDSCIDSFVPLINGRQLTDEKRQDDLTAALGTGGSDADEIFKNVVSGSCPHSTLMTIYRRMELWECCMVLN